MWPVRRTSRPRGGHQGRRRAGSKEPSQEPTATGTRPHRATASQHRRRQTPHQATSSTLQQRRIRALQARGHWFEPSCAHQVCAARCPAAAARAEPVLRSPPAPPISGYGLSTTASASPSPPRNVSAERRRDRPAQGPAAGPAPSESPAAAGRPGTPAKYGPFTDIWASLYAPRELPALNFGRRVRRTSSGCSTTHIGGMTECGVGHYHSWERASGA